MNAYIYYIDMSEDNLIRDKIDKKYYKKFDKSVSPYLGRLSSIELPNGKTYYLYAYTVDKHTAEEFEHFYDMKKFLKRKVKITKEQLNATTEDRSGLDYAMIFANKVDPDHIVNMTYFESFIVQDMESELSEDLYYLASLIPYDIFKKEIIEAMDKLLLCTYNKISGEDGDYYSYDYSFGVTAEGATHGAVKEEYKELEIYLKTFQILFRKD